MRQRTTAPREPLLTPAEIAAVLQVSINTARRIMRENGGLWVGSQLRWTNVKLERYLRSGETAGTAEHHFKNDSTSETPSGMPGDTTTPAGNTPYPPTKPIGKPRLRLLDKSNAISPFLRPITPATQKRSRSRKP
jgi:hypothetical protein